MIDEQRQRISELQDGELDRTSAAHLVDDLTIDPQLRGVWERYHLIGLAIRNEPLAIERRSIADGVRERLATEPTVLAPGRVEPRHPRHPFKHRPRPRAKSAYAGIALAAAAAFVAVFVVLPVWIDGGTSGSSGAGSAPPFTARMVASEAPTKRWHLDRPELANKLDLFLVTHQDTAPAAGAKGMLPYATFVGYEAGH
ncbi:MAG: hypothetical protein EOM91_13625 [Sphingobacteriia bacterium]|nr:hypothetical protein [Sphingobacteriia bacterium]NCC38786.1 hypothetical protein [Gammaproteobacteria bacterium]